MKMPTDNTPKRKMLAETFDPFKDRLSRDIRNTLSEAFCGAFVRMEPMGYRDAAEKWLATKPADIYCAYIRNRMLRYDRVFDTINAHCLTFITNLDLLIEKLKTLDPVPPKLENPALR